jgi:hypothetical protein
MDALSSHFVLMILLHTFSLNSLADRQLLRGWADLMVCCSGEEAKLPAKFRVTQPLPRSVVRTDRWEGYCEKVRLRRRGVMRREGVLYLVFGPPRVLESFSTTQISRIEDKDQLAKRIKIKKADVTMVLREWVQIDEGV